MEPNPESPIVAIMASSSALVASMVSPSSEGASGSRFGRLWEEDGPAPADGPENNNVYEEMHCGRVA